MAEILCSKCGAELPEGFSFCYQCGNKIEQDFSKSDLKSSENIIQDSANSPQINKIDTRKEMSKPSGESFDTTNKNKHMGCAITAKLSLTHIKHQNAVASYSANLKATE